MANSAKEKIRKRMEKYQANISRLKKERVRLKKEVKKLKLEKRKILDDKRKLLSKKEKKIEDLKSRLKSKGKTADIAEEKDELIEELEDENIALENQIEELNEENKRLMDDIEQREGPEEVGGVAIKSGDDLVLKSNSEVHGDIQCTESVTLEDSVNIAGTIRAESDIFIGKDCQVEGDLISEEGAVEVGSGCMISGMIKGNGVVIAEDVNSADIESQNDVTIKKNSQVADVTALGNVELEDGVKVEGSIEYAGGLSAGNRVTITDSVIPRSKEEIEGEDLEAEEELEEEAEEREEELEEEEEQEEGSEETEEEAEDEGEEEEEGSEEDLDYKECPICNEENELDAKYCKSCGAGLD